MDRRTLWERAVEQNADVSKVGLLTRKLFPNHAMLVENELEFQRNEVDGKFLAILFS